MDAVRVTRRTSASTLATVGTWGAAGPEPFVLKMKEAAETSVAEAGEKALTWVPGADLGVWLLRDKVVRSVSSEVTATIPLDEGARTEADRIDELLGEPVGTPVNLSRNEAAELIRRLFGSDKSLPNGTEYVKRVRGDWTLRLPAG